MYHKILAYFLLAAGLLIMAFAARGMYRAFVQRAPVPVIVQIQDLSVQTQHGPLQIPAQPIGALTNLALFAIFMTFVLVAGGKLAGIGAKLLKAERLHDALLTRQKATAQDEFDSFKKL